MGGMQERRDDRIGPTAHYTAWVWHRLGMPNAELFASRRGQRLFWTMRLAGEWITTVSRTVPSMDQYLELRHRLIERALDDYVPDRIVELGAGLSRRGVTWAARGVPYLEVDLSHMIEAKRARLVSAPRALLDAMGDRHQLVSLDVLGDGFTDALGSAIAGFRRPAVVAEGLLGYFAIDDRAKLYRSIATALARASGGMFVCDLRAREGNRRTATAAKVLKMGIALVTRGRGAREDYPSSEAVRSHLLNAGFDSATPLDPERYPELEHLRGLATPARVWTASAESRAVDTTATCLVDPTAT